MMTADEFTALALSLPAVEESAHFGKRDFRGGGKIFATLLSDDVANLNFTPDQQSMMLEMHADLFTALPKSWGARGWTSLSLERAPIEIAEAALSTARANLLAKKPKRKG